MRKQFFRLIGLCLVAFAIPAFGQTSDNGVGEVNIYASGAINYNPSCEEEKFGAGVGVDAEYRIMPWVGVGLGAGFSSEGVAWQTKFGSFQNQPQIEMKYDERLPFINVPLRLYAHPVDWLTLEAGIQFSYVLDDKSITGLSRTCWSVPVGVSVGNRYRVFFRYQPRLGDMIKSGKVESNVLLLGIRMEI